MSKKKALDIPRLHYTAITILRQQPTAPETLLRRSDRTQNATITILGPITRRDQPLAIPIGLETAPHASFRTIIRIAIWL